MYLIFGIISLILLLLLLAARIPKVTLLEEEKINVAAIRALLKEPIIIIYTLGIFFYVGAEVSVGSNMVAYLKLPDVAGLENADASKFRE